MLPSYNQLRLDLEDKTRGRYQEANVNKSPPVWAKLNGDRIDLHFEPSSGGRTYVGCLLEGNRFEFHWHGYATAVTRKIAYNMFGLGWRNHAGKGWVSQYFDVGDNTGVACYLPAPDVVTGIGATNDRLPNHDEVSQMRDRLLDFNLEEHLTDVDLVRMKMGLCGNFTPALTKGVMAYLCEGVFPNGLRDLRTLAEGTKILPGAVIRRYK